MKKKAIIKTVLIILAVIILTAGCGAVLFNRYYSMLNTQERNTEETEDTSKISRQRLVPVGESDDEAVKLTEDDMLTLDEQLRRSLEALSDKDFLSDDVKNILIIGVDNQDPATMDMPGNADGLVILSINSKEKKLALTSIMRDVIVRVPAGYYTKITSSYHDGGVGALISSIESNFGIGIDNYVLFDYIAVADVVDAFGGVGLEVSRSEILQMQDKIINLDWLMGKPLEDMLYPEQEGYLTLNGVQAAAYMRIRLDDRGDYGRTDRIRNVIIKLLQKLPDKKLTELDGIAQQVLPQISTDITQSQARSLLLSSVSLTRYDTVSQRLPLSGTYSGTQSGDSGLIVDFDANRRAFYDSIR